MVSVRLGSGLNEIAASEAEKALPGCCIDSTPVADLR
jgi:hypothetical protein